MGDLGKKIFSKSTPRARGSTKRVFSGVFLGSDSSKTIFRMNLKFSQVLDNWYTQVLKLQINDMFNIFENNQIVVIF